MKRITFSGRSAMSAGLCAVLFLLAGSMNIPVAAESAENSAVENQTVENQAARESGAVLPQHFHGDCECVGHSDCDSASGQNLSPWELELLVSDEIWMTGSVRAMLCSNCGFGNRKDNCCRCGKWMGGTRIPAYLCNDCGFGSRKDECVVCGKWIGSGGVPANLCGNCGFGSRKDNCAKCGKWRGGN